MPIYEYTCLACEREFEKLVPSQAAPVSCPVCGADRVMRRLSLFRARTAVPSGAPSSGGAAPMGGGCCGGGCGCH